MLFVIIKNNEVAGSMGEDYAKKNAEYFFLYGAVIHNRCTDTYPKKRKNASCSDGK